MTGLSRLTTREKRLLALGGAVLLIAGLWLYVWQPLAEARAMQEARIARYLAVLDITDRVSPTVPKEVSSCTDAGPLGPRITQSAETAGIPLARLDPEGARLRITVAETGYAEAMAWIAALEARSCARATSVEMARLTQPGQVSMRMTLEEAR